MTHILVIIVFALIVSLVFGLLGKDAPKDQVRYGLSVFAKFVGIAIALAWVLYFFPL